MLDQRGQLLRAALGFAGLPLPSYDRALHALRVWLVSPVDQIGGGELAFGPADGHLGIGGYLRHSATS